MPQDAATLLTQAQIVEDVVKALRQWGERLRGKTAPPPDSHGRMVFPAALQKYIDKQDRQATRELFELVAKNGKLLRRLLNEYGCHDHVHPKIQSMLNLAARFRQGKDMGGYWNRAENYAGDHLWCGPCSVPKELGKWARRLEAEAAGGKGYLRPSAAKAYSQYLEAKVRNPHLGTDDDVYDWLSENEDDDGKKYKLPPRDTWKRQVRRARRYHGKQKNTPRAGREGGKSIVRGSEIEYQHGADDD